MVVDIDSGEEDRQSIMDSLSCSLSEAYVIHFKARNVYLCIGVSVLSLLYMVFERAVQSTVLNTFQRVDKVNSELAVYVVA